MTYLVENKRVCLQKTGSWASKVKGLDALRRDGSRGGAGARAHESLAADLRRVMGDLDDLEADLAALQDKAGLPRFDRSKPLTEWLMILGVSKELIEPRQSMPQCSRSDQRRAGAAEMCQGIACGA